MDLVTLLGIGLNLRNPSSPPKMKNERTAKGRSELTMTGIPIAKGTAFGEAVLIHATMVAKPNYHYRIAPDDVPEEVGRVKQAIQLLLLVVECSEAYLAERYGMTAASAFGTQRVFLEDGKLRERIIEMIQSRKYRAETAVRSILEHYRQRLSSSDSALIRERVEDIVDLKNSLLDALNNPGHLLREGSVQRKGLHRDRIAVAHELTPRLVIEQNFENIRGIITEKGGQTSHAAILCRALGIPCVSGIGRAQDTMEDGTRVLLCGDEGQVVIAPEAKTVRMRRHRGPAAASRLHKTASEHNLRIQIMATINFARDALAAVEAGAEGIGLYRTEFEFMVASRLLTEAEQEERYAEVVKVLNGRPCHIRLLDIAEDKRLSMYQGPLDSPHSQSRGAAFLLEHADVLCEQARALAKASRAGEIRIIYPMISNVLEFQTLRSIVTEAAENTKGARLRHGVMFEQPSACLAAESLLATADFGCIGTNDLVRFLFGVDRSVTNGIAESMSENPILWGLLRDMAQTAQKASKPLVLCGELAGDSGCRESIIESGIRTLSVPLQVLADLCPRRP